MGESMKNLMQQIVESYLCSDAALQVIGKAVEETFKRQIQEQIGGHHSEFRKQLDEGILKALKINGSIDVPSYNDAILKVIERQVRGATEQAIERQVASRIKSLLQPVPEKIKLSELLEQYRRHLRDKAMGGCTCSTEGRFGVTIEYRDGWVYLTVWEDIADKRSNRTPSFRMAIYRSKSYSLSIDGHGDAKRAMFVGPLYEFEKMLFQIHAAQTEIELDIVEGDVDTHYGDGE